jgi:hypothetical protein
VKDRNFDTVQLFTFEFSIFGFSFDEIESKTAKNQHIKMRVAFFFAATLVFREVSGTSGGVTRE